MNDSQIHFDGIAPELVGVSATSETKKAKPISTRSAESREPREILFLALLLDESLFATVTKRVALTCRTHGFTRRPIAAERLHISLLGFGEYSDERAAAITRIAETVRFPSINISLDRAMSFQIRGRTVNPFVLTSAQGLDHVREFYRVLSAVFAEEKAGTKINPHMTLIWDTKAVPEYALTKPLTWTAHEFVLVRSFQGQGRYEIVHRWPFLAT